MFVSLSECLESSPTEKNRKYTKRSDDDTTCTKALEMELDKINQYRADHYKSREFDDILKMYTEDCTFVIEHRPPGIGKKGNLSIANHRQ